MTAAYFECSGCGRRVALGPEHPFACPAAIAGDDIDHVLVRRVELPAESSDAAPHTDGSPYVAWRKRLSLAARAQALGVDDAQLVALCEQLDAAVAEVDGVGFRVTPLREATVLVADRSGPGPGSLWAKDETGNVSGSHKARHLMGVMLHLRLVELSEGAEPEGRRPLAIASCGNAALAAAVVAAAAQWPLRVFVPPDAAPAVLERLADLGAQVTTCPRDGQPGDPCMRAFRAALAEGHLPFSVQGGDNGLAVEGGLTLGYELAAQIRQGPGRLDALMVQVGGGALASACVYALRDAVALGILPTMPRVHTVQTTGAWPLRRAYERIVERIAAEVGQPPPADARARADWLQRQPPTVLDAALRHAATHRSDYMWPWESEPHSVAYGILDDETYDWWALCDGMIRTGGVPIVASENDLVAAQQAVHERLGVPVCATGTAGVAGVWTEPSRFDADDVVAVLLTGARRRAPNG